MVLTPLFGPFLLVCSWTHTLGWAQSFFFEMHSLGRDFPYAFQIRSCTAGTHNVCVCVCVVFSSHSFWTSMDVPAGVTQEEGNTGFSIHLFSEVLALMFLARRIQSFLSMVDREVEFSVLTI